MVSWILSVLAAILAIGLVFGVIFTLVVVFDELCKFWVVRCIGRIILPVIGLAAIIATVGGVSIGLYGWWEHRDEQLNKPLVQPIDDAITAAVIHDAGLVHLLDGGIYKCEKSPETDASGNPCVKRVIEHIVDGPADDIRSHRWFEYVNGKWNTLSEDPAVTFASVVLYVRGDDGKYVLSDYAGEDVELPDTGEQ